MFAEILKASSEIAHMTAKEKKPHNISETLIKTVLVKSSGSCFILKKDIKCQVFKNALQPIAYLEKNFGCLHRWWSDNVLVSK